MPSSVRSLESSRIDIEASPLAQTANWVRGHLDWARETGRYDG